MIRRTSVLVAAITFLVTATLGGVCEALPSLKPRLHTVCASGSWQPPNKVLYVEADCPAGAIALGGGPLGDPGNEFDTTLKASSGPLLNSKGQPVGWTYTSVRDDSGLNDAQFESIGVEVCVECAN